ncbi:hypothetical protein L1887_12117, partial [Cichorium endivia]
CLLFVAATGQSLEPQIRPPSEQAVVTRRERARPPFFSNPALVMYPLSLGFLCYLLRGQFLVKGHWNRIFLIDSGF